MSMELPEHASVVVIGGGVIGASIAFHLAESGVSDVLLLEKDELASGSTCKAAGGVRASFSNQPPTSPSACAASRCTHASPGP